MQCVRGTRHAQSTAVRGGPLSVQVFTHHNPCGVDRTHRTQHHSHMATTATAQKSFPDTAPTAAVFGVLDVLLQLTMRPAAARLVRGGGKAGAELEANVTKTLLIVLSFLHLMIQVRLACTRLVIIRIGTWLKHMLLCRRQACSQQSAPLQPPQLN